MSASPPQTPIPGGANRPWLIAGAIGLVLVTLLMGIRWGSILSQPRTGAVTRIVVLPFAVRDPAFSAQAAGLVREIARELGSRPGLRAVAGGLVPQGAARGRTPRQIGRDFGAVWVLAGELSFEESADRFDLELRLLRVEDDAEVWREHRERGRGELLGWPKEIADEIAARVMADQQAASEAQPRRR